MRTQRKKKLRSAQGLPDLPDHVLDGEHSKVMDHATRDILGSPLKVAVFETKHEGLVMPSLQFFDDGVNEMFMFVTDEVLRSIPRTASAARFKRVGWHIHDRPGHEREFLALLEETAKREGVDLIWISSITNNFLACARVVRRLRRRGCRTVMTLHNLNWWFRPSLPRGIRALKNVIGQRALLASVDGVNVISETLVPYVRNRIRDDRAIFAVPDVIVDGAGVNCESPPPDGIVVVPGRIEKRRRDYGLALDSCEELAKRGVKMTLVLLGAPVDAYGQEIVRRCERVRARGTPVVWFEEVVSEGDFRCWMKRASMIAAPLNVVTSFAGSAEVYGLTKGSSVVGDMLRYRRPALVPMDLLLPSALEGAVLRYAGRADFHHQLGEYLTSVTVRESLWRNLEEAGAHFTRSRVWARNVGAFCRLFAIER